MPQIAVISPDHPQPGPIEKAAGILSSSGVVIMPTRGLYGLGCDALNAAAVKRIFKIKGRPLNKPLLVLISHRDMLPRIVSSISPLAAELMDAFWPGRITLVMEGRSDLPQGLCSQSGKVGVRLVGHPAAAALVNAAAMPITGTSANLAGAGGCARIDAIDAKITASVDMVLDAGPLEGGPGSSVVDVTGHTPHILREGAVAASAILKVFERFAACRVDKQG